MTIHKPQLTFGVEIERVKFYNGQPIKAAIAVYLNNADDADHSSPAKTHLIREKMADGSYDDRFTSVIKFDYESDVTEDIPLDSNGKILPPWEENVEGRCDTAFDPNLKGSVIDQARTLLAQNGLQNWDTLEDHSLTDSGVDAIELASPVLEQGEFNSIEQICEIFNPITENDATCGLHIHIGVKDRRFKCSQLQRFIELWLKTEVDLLKNSFCQPEAHRNLPLTWRTDLNTVQKASNIEKLIETVNPHGRAYLINLHALKKYGTIEFRGFRGTMDAALIREIVGLCEEKVLESM